MRLTINQNDYRKHRVIVSSCSTRLAYFARSKAAATPVSASSFKKKKKRERKGKKSAQALYMYIMYNIYKSVLPGDRVASVRNIYVVILLCVTLGASRRSYFLRSYSYFSLEMAHFCLFLRIRAYLCALQIAFRNKSLSNLISQVWV